MNICESVKENFLNTFQLLSRKQQKIWRYIQWYAQHYRQVFPSHATIAEAVGCCRDTVIETIKKFSQWRWLGTMKRCFRTNLYFIANELIDLDTTKPDTFKRIQETAKSTEAPTVKPTQNPTLYETKSNAVDVRKTFPEPKIVQQIKCKEVTHILESIGISGKDLWCLARYSLLAVAKAVEDYKTRKAPGPIRNLAAWLTNRCKSYS